MRHDKNTAQQQNSTGRWDAGFLKGRGKQVQDIYYFTKGRFPAHCASFENPQKHWKVSEYKYLGICSEQKRKTIHTDSLASKLKQTEKDLYTEAEQSPLCSAGRRTVEESGGLEMLSWLAMDVPLPPPLSLHWTRFTARHSHSSQVAVTPPIIALCLMRCDGHLYTWGVVRAGPFPTADLTSALH